MVKWVDFNRRVDAPGDIDRYPYLQKHGVEVGWIQLHRAGRPVPVTGGYVNVEEEAPRLRHLRAGERFPAQGTWMLLADLNSAGGPAGMGQPGRGYR